MGWALTADFLDSLCFLWLFAGYILVVEDGVDNVPDSWLHVVSRLQQLSQLTDPLLLLPFTYTVQYKENLYSNNKIFFSPNHIK